MSSEDKYVIPFESLKDGKHEFDYQIESSFFEVLEYSIIEGGDVSVHFELDKKETMMVGKFEMEGTVQTACDRCMDSMDVPVEVSHQVVYQFSDDISEDENLINVPSTAFTIDISSTIYELLTVALPSRTVHEEDECNEEMLDLLDQYEGYEEDFEEEEEEDEEDIDPRWKELRKLK